MLVYCPILVVVLSVLAFLGLSQLAVFFRYRSVMASISTSLELQETIFRLGGKMTFTKLLMNEVPRRSGTAKLHTTLETSLTPESPIRICNFIVPTTLTFWFVAFFNDSRFFPV